MINQLLIEESYGLLQPEKLKKEVVNAAWLCVKKYWVLKKETSEYFLFTRNNVSVKGHIIIAILLGWWLLFIPNFIYHIVMKEQKIIYK